ADGRACSATAAVGKQSHVGPGLEPANIPMGNEKAKFDKVIATSAGPELRPCSIFVLFGNRAYIPIGIHHLVPAAILERSANAKARLGFNRAAEAVLVPF